jgi:cytidylate kinase
LNYIDIFTSRGVVMSEDDDNPRIAVVGPCGAGKSALVERLRPLGYNIRAVSQEHSYVPDMWRRVAHTDILIYLDATLETIAKRRDINWGQDRLDALNTRLRHARAHADLYLPTDDLTADTVAQKVVVFLDSAPER